MNLVIVDIGRNESSWAGFEAERARQERKRHVAIRRLIPWSTRKHRPEMAQLLERRLADGLKAAANQYMNMARCTDGN